MDASTRTALETRYKDQLAALKAMRASLKGILKVRQPITLATLYKWYKDKKLIIADWNRDEVDDRIGTHDDWMESIATDVSGGICLAYWNGKPITEKNGVLKCTPTVDNPVVIYEGGHRTRWTYAIFENVARCLGMTLAELMAVEPVTARAIQTCVVEMTIATSLDNDALVKFAKRDYDRVNTYIEKLKAGEVLRTHTDDARTALEERLVGVMKRTLKKKARDAHLEDQRALIHCAAGLVTKMDKKKGSLVYSAPLTEEQIEMAETNIDAMGEIESKVETLFTGPTVLDKKVKTRIKNRQIDLALDGTIMWALQSVDEDGRAAVIEDAVTFYRMFFGNNDSWKEVLAEIKKATKERSRYEEGETPYPIRWSRIQNKIRPPPPVNLEDDIDVPVAVAI
jgi:hypothetical protein